MGGGGKSRLIAASATTNATPKLSPALRRTSTLQHHNTIRCNNLKSHSLDRPRLRTGYIPHLQILLLLTHTNQTHPRRTLRLRLIALARHNIPRPNLTLQHPLPPRRPLRLHPPSLHRLQPRTLALINRRPAQLPSLTTIHHIRDPNMSSECEI